MMKKLIITGMPRSGTSWLGQLINSSPVVSFRTEPLFAYRFKNSINAESSSKDINTFFNNLIEIDDDFILQKDKLQEGVYPQFEKTAADVLAFKTTRHFELLERYMNSVEELNIVAIIRHPCAVINSWFKSYREFEKKGCEQQRDWRSGGCRKNEIGEYWGFDDWLVSTKLFLQLAENYPNFHIIRYSDVVNNTEQSVQQLFSKLELEYTQQPQSFIHASHQRHDDDPYSVFKRKSVLNSWQNVLDNTIAETIERETQINKLDFFLS